MSIFHTRQSIHSTSYMNNSDANGNRVPDRETLVTVVVARERMRHDTSEVLGGKSQYRCVLTQFLLRHRNYEKQGRFSFEENTISFMYILCILNNKLFIIWYFMIYLLTAIGLSPDGSTHLHTNNTYNTNNNRTTQITTEQHK